MRDEREKFESQRAEGLRAQRHDIDVEGLRAHRHDIDVDGAW